MTDQSLNVRLPSRRGCYHLGGEIVPVIRLLHRAATADVIERRFRVVTRYASPGHSGAGRAPQIVSTPVTNTESSSRRCLRRENPRQHAPRFVVESVCWGDGARRPNRTQFGRGECAQRQRDATTVLRPFGWEDPSRFVAVNLTHGNVGDLHLPCGGENGKSRICLALRPERVGSVPDPLQFFIRQNAGSARDPWRDDRPSLSGQWRRDPPMSLGKIEKARYQAV